LFNNSKYIYAVDPVAYGNTSSTWGSTLAGKQFATLETTQTVTLSNGADCALSDGNLISAYDQFANAETIDISLVLTGAASIAVQQDVIDIIAEGRKDCVAFISPPSSAVISQAGIESDNISTWLTSLSRSSSYVMADSGWKYMFDKYNNTYRWVPLNGDIAGLCVNTDNVRDPWFSPAGLNRGNLKNVVKLAWNPNKSFRDAIYSKGVNPVVSLAGNGTVLYGDKTLQAKPSAFDRINVRRLFIVLEKAIAQAAKYSLFEFNDDFTRAQFVSLVAPFLRDVQGRRGIYDFRVVCDTTNNTPEVIDGNRFVGDIYIKPARSINFIQLNFVAVRTGVDFTEVVGKF
jgi:phage tail sheath protein FI